MQTHIDIYLAYFFNEECNFCLKINILCQKQYID